MSTLTGLPSKLSAEDYGRLSTVIGFRDELIEGERVLAHMPKFAHTVVLDKLETLLRQQLPNLRITRAAGWRFQSDDGAENVPGPDLMAITAEQYDKASRSGGYFEGQPFFVIEVISSVERKARRLQKVGLYLDAGAGAVVEIDYAKKLALIYRPDEDAPEVVTDRIVFPFQLQLADIF